MGNSALIFENIVDISNSRLTITQATHGLSVGNLVKFTGGAYAKAQADSAVNAEVVGIVTQVADTNTFTLVTAGIFDGLSGLTANTLYYLDPDTAGAYTSTQPTVFGDVDKPVFFATSTTGGIFLQIRGFIVGTNTRTGVYRGGWIPANGMTPRTTNGAAAGTTEVGATNKIMIETLDFDPGTPEAAGFWVHFDETWNGGTVKAKIYWTADSATATQLCDWEISARAFGDDDPIDAALGTIVTVNDAFIATHDMHVSTVSGAITATGSDVGDAVYFQIERDADDATNDTVSTDAKLIGIYLQFQESATEPAQIA